MRTVLVLSVVGLLLAGCGVEARDPAKVRAHVSRPTDVPAAAGLVRTRGPVLVLEADDGPQACLGGVAASLPPQCGGPAITNWDWSEHEGDYEQRSGVRWGSFVLTGTFDGRALTLTDVGSERGPDYPEEPLLGTPCAEPEGGWRVVDPARTNEQTREAVFRTAGHLDGFAADWVDQSINPAYPFDGPDGEMRANDPTRLVVNVAVTGDVAAAERELRAVWGGALCVTHYEHTAAELRRIQAEVNDLPGMLTSGSGDGRDRVTLEVTYDDGSIQRWCDTTFGKGTVEVSSALVPAPA